MFTNYKISLGRLGELRHYLFISSLKEAKDTYLFHKDANDYTVVLYGITEAGEEKVLA